MCCIYNVIVCAIGTDVTMGEGTIGYEWAPLNWTSSTALKAGIEYANFMLNRC